MDTFTGDVIQERARIIRIEGDTAWVQCESQAGCARCAAGEGCGAGLFARLLRGRLQELPVTLPRPLITQLAHGDWLLLGLSVSAVQTASFLLYGLPLAGLLLGAVAAGFIVPGDTAAFIGAAAGLAAGLGIARRWGARLAGSGALQAIVLRPLGANEPCSPRPEA